MIVERIPGYTDKMMIEYISLLLSVVTKTKEISIGRGKNIQKKKVLHFNTDPEVIKKLEESLIYYKQCNSETINETSSNAEFDF